MTGGWSYSGEPASVGVGAVTLVEGSSFCICAPSGDIRGSTHGVFFNDTRILSAWEIALDGAGIESLTVTVGEPWRATFISRAPPRPGRSESTVLMRAERFVGQGMREDLVLQNLSNETAAVQVLIRLDSDFADLFEVKEGRVPDRPRPTRSVLNSALLLERFYASGASLGVQVTGSGAGVTPSGLVFQAVVPPRGEWRTSLQVLPMIDGVVLPPRYPTDRALEETTPARQERQWRESAPVVRTDDPALGVILERSRVDLGALRIVDPDAPENVVVAAGAPWFMALFGRDSLLTSYMALPLDQSLALGTLTTLARLQGRDVDPLSEEEPGRILHEVRLGGEPSRVPGGRKIYYGTADATPLRRSTRCCPARTVRWPGSAATAIVTATASSSTSGAPTGGWSTRAGRTPGTGSTSPTARCPAARSPSARSRPTSTRPSWLAPTSRGRAATRRNGGPGRTGRAP
jgi:glycogen debranching enzyme